MPNALTVDNLADAALNASSAFNRRMTEAWTTHFRNNAELNRGTLHYMGVQIDANTIKAPHAIGNLLRSKGVILIEGVLAHHFETAIPHLAAHLIDEYLELDSVNLRNPADYRHPARNEFLNPVRIFSDGPLINAQIDYEEKVVWAQHSLWLKDTALAEVYRVSLEAQTMGSIYEHPFMDPELKIENITSDDKSIMIYPKIVLRSVNSLRVYRTGRGGVLMAPNEAAGL